MKRLLNSFRNAFRGFADAVRTQANMRIHLIAAAVAIGISAYLSINASEWIWISAAIALVWMAELFNTAIEGLCDLYSRERRDDIRFIKDTAAAAVTVAAVFALITAAIIWLPHVR